MKNFTLLLFLAIFGNLYSQQITRDTSFGNNGFSAFTIQTVNDLTDTVLLPNGQFITGYASVTSVGWSLSLKKINADGTIDTSFTGGLSRDGAIQFEKLVYHNDKLYFFGSYAIYPYNNRNLMVVRFNMNGDIDTTFGSNGQTLYSYGSGNDDPLDVVIDAAGNSFVYAKHSSDYYLMKLDANGMIDATFGSGGSVYLHTYSVYNNSTNKILNKMYLQNDGKFMFVGAKRNLSTDINESYLVRKLPDGTDDLSFGTNGELVMANTSYSSIKDVQFDYANNTILLLHQYDNSNQVRDRVFLSKIQLSDGALHTTFANNGMTSQYSFTGAPNLFLYHITVLSDSKMLVAGSVSDFTPSPSINRQLFVMRFNSDGSIDYSSSSNGYHIFETTPPDSSMRADFVSQLFDLDNGSFIIAYSGDSATHGAHSYLAKFNGATLGLNDVDDQRIKFAISPNPSKEYLTVTNLKGASNSFEYKIIDLIGSVVQQGNANFNEKITLNDLSTGTYIFSVQSELGKKSSKIIIK
ncbi:T9SS type A sorting domain-containing protein [Kordia jejudonensis]|uniref:T9SS type A sorting domain-containing protein n=1 Tax=Kordia jejudonensis TaxID=1348245 RepID=UPI000629949F|nr:T9SS type A sorting domain-containing protein [Kordia jejudonensis]